MEDTKVETANEGGFFITNIHSEQVDGVKLIKTKLTRGGVSVGLSLSSSTFWKPVKGLGLAHRYNMGRPRKKINQTKLALASTVFFLSLQEQRNDISTSA